MRLLIVSATEPELRQTADWLEASAADKSRSRTLANDRQTVETERLVSGVGQLQTAYCLLKRIYTHRPDFIVQAGIGGSTDTKQIGKVFGIQTERLADLGVKEKSGFHSIFDLRLAHPDHFPFSEGLLKNPYKYLMAWSGLSFVDGLTVNEVSTDPGRILELKQNNPNFVESMEGAALHFVCLLEKIPFLQIRAVSNLLGERDKSRWKLTESIGHLNDALIVFIQKLQTIDENIFRV